MERKSYFKKSSPKSSRTAKRLKVRNHSETNDIKDEIQATARDIVIERDKGCILRGHPDAPQCNGYRKDGQLILQAEHLETRANAATFADTRLIVCICKGHHGWKKWNKERYDELVYDLLPPDRQLLWDRAHAARYLPHRKYTYDWRMELAALKQELAQLQAMRRTSRTT